MTSNTHERASDRVAEAAKIIEADIVVLVQGDEPMTVPSMIDSALKPMLKVSLHVVMFKITNTDRLLQLRVLDVWRLSMQNDG